MSDSIILPDVGTIEFCNPDNSVMFKEDVVILKMLFEKIGGERPLDEWIEEARVELQARYDCVLMSSQVWTIIDVVTDKFMEIKKKSNGEVTSPPGSQESTPAD